MPTERGGGGGAVIGGKIYVAGGRPPRGSDFAVYDPVANTWETLPDLPTQRNHIGVASLGVLVFGIMPSPLIDAVRSAVEALVVR
mgnify:CR=1 FL=1